MFTEERQKKIIDIVNQEQRISVKELTQRLDFSPATIRSDLNSLDEQGLLVRIHGGATSIDENSTNKSLNINFNLREHENHEEKKEIATKAIEFIQEDNCIILDASSTSLELGKLINNTNLRLMILTNGLHVANILKNNKNITTVLIGGVIQGNSNAIQGTLGEDLLKKVNVDAAFISAHAFSLNKGLTDFNIYEVELKKIMIRNAKKIYALMDYSKLEKTSISQFGTANDINYFITNNKVKKNIKKKYQEYGMFIL